MNLKPNLWTLLFVLSLLLWGYSYTQKDSQPTLMQADPKAYTIDSERFQNLRKEYIDKVKPCLDSCSIIPYSGPIYYRIAWDELSALYQEDSSASLFIIPIVEKFKDKNEECQPSISLAFSTIHPGEDGEITVIEGAGNIYNFATPCPPLCEQVNPFKAVCLD